MGWNLRPSNQEIAAYCVACGVAGFVAGIACCVLIARSA